MKTENSKLSETVGGSSRKVRNVPTVRLPPTGFVLDFSSEFNKNRYIRFQVCRTILIQSALERSDPGASNGGSELEIRPLGTVLIAFKVVELLQNQKKITRIISNHLATQSFQS